MSQEQQAELEVLTKANLATVKAHQIRLAFEEAYLLETVALTKGRKRTY